MGDTYTRTHNASEHTPLPPFEIARGRGADHKLWKTWAVDCSCGWQGPICSDVPRGKFLWRQHEKAQHGPGEFPGGY